MIGRIVDGRVGPRDRTSGGHSFDMHVEKVIVTRDKHWARVRSAVERTSEHCLAGQLAAVENSTVVVIAVAAVALERLAYWDRCARSMMHVQSKDYY